MPDNTNTSTNDAPVAASPFTWKFWAIMAAVVLLGFIGSRLVGRMFDATVKFGHLPVIHQIESDLVGTERSGQTVSLSSLRGKVCVVGYIYTICPHGCAAVIGEMRQMLQDYGARDDFHLVSVTVVPERDTPALLKGFAEGLDVKDGDPWWFINGDRVQMDAFMSQNLRLSPAELIPEEERMNPLDLYKHDLRLTLVDRKGRVRGHYQVAHPQAEIAEMAKTKLRHDTQNLLNHPDH